MLRCSVVDHRSRSAASPTRPASLGSILRLWQVLSGSSSGSSKERRTSSGSGPGTTGPSRCSPASSSTCSAGEKQRADGAMRSSRECGPCDSEASQASVDLYWLPLGAGGHFVRLNGRIFEAVAARLQKRTTRDLYHSALEVRVPHRNFTIEMAWPIPDGNGALRGVVAEGPVGSSGARSLRILRYEIRRWRDGLIPDIDEAVDSPQRLTDDPAVAQRVLELVPEVPTPVWGRDELQTGEMWNSNSLISWLIARSGLDVEAVHPPVGGRAPGWHAGMVIAGRQEKADARTRTGDPFITREGRVGDARPLAGTRGHVLAGNSSVLQVRQGTLVPACPSLRTVL